MGARTCVRVGRGTGNVGARLNGDKAAKKAAVEAQISRTGRDGAYLHYQWGEPRKPTG